MKIIDKLLNENHNLLKIQRNEYDERIEVMKSEIIFSIFEKVDISIMEKDKLFVACKFAKLFVFFYYGKELADLFDIFYTPSKLIEANLDKNLLMGKLHTSQRLLLEDLSH